jgi:hypothetical protein
MTYAEFQAELRRAGLNIGAFADLVGMKRNSVSNYSGATDVPHHLAVISVLLAELASVDVDFRPAIARVGASPKKARGGSKPGRFGGHPQSELELDP